MKGLIKAFDELPFIVKLLFCIPCINIVWQIYKICRSADKGNVLGIVLGVLCIIPGCVFIWIIDLLTLIVKGDRVWWLD